MTGRDTLSIPDVSGNFSPGLRRVTCGRANSSPVSDALEGSGDVQGIACCCIDGAESDSTLSMFVSDATEGSINCSMGSGLYPTNRQLLL